MLKLKVTKQSEAIKELLQMTIPSIDYSQGYQVKPRVRRNLMGAASSLSKTAKDKDKDKDRYILQNITELLSRTIVK